MRRRTRRKSPLPGRTPSKADSRPDTGGCRRRAGRWLTAGVGALASTVGSVPATAETLQAELREMFRPD